MTGLPYFQFYASDWLSGKIAGHAMEVQGVFINLCARMWKSRGYVENNPAAIARLLHCQEDTISNCLILLEQDEIICLDSERGWYVKFLLEQLKHRSAVSVKRSEAGRKGGKKTAKQLQSKSKAKAYNQNQNQNQNKDTPVVPSGDDGRQDALPGIPEPDKELPVNYKAWDSGQLLVAVNAANTKGILMDGEVADFVGYWMEKSPTGKARLSMERTWDTGRRMHNAVKMIYSDQRAKDAQQSVGDDPNETPF